MRPFIGPILSITGLILQVKVYKVTDSLPQHLFYCQQVNAESHSSRRDNTVAAGLINTS